MRDARPPVTIIGAGIVGICCGLTLIAEGYPVTIIDPKVPGTATSFGNAGIIGDAMIMPINAPGLWQKLPWMLFSPMSPMRLRWRYLPDALPWLSRFLIESRASSARRRAGEIASVNTFAGEAHRSLMRQHRIDTGLIRSDGVLQLFRRQEPGLDRGTAGSLNSLATMCRSIPNVAITSTSNAARRLI